MIWQKGETDRQDQNRLEHAGRKTAIHQANELFEMMPSFKYLVNFFLCSTVVGQNTSKLFKVEIMELSFFLYIISLEASQIHLK